MIVLDEVEVHSVQIWNWLNKVKGTILDFDKKKPAEIKHFRFLMSKEENWNYESYYEMSAGMFWKVFNEVFKLASGIPTNPLPISVSVDDVEDELEKVIRVLIWWCFAEAVDETLLEDLDYMLVNKEKRSVNFAYRFNAYYMYKEIYERLAKTKKVLDGRLLSRMNELTQYHTACPMSIAKVKEFIDSQVQKACAGDADEFAIYTVDVIQRQTLTDNHEKMAQLVRFYKFGMADFESKLPPGQVWQILFSDYFDGVDEVFDEFYEKFKNECIMYFLNDYTACDYDIIEIPWYKVYCNEDDKENYTSSVLNLLNVPRIKKRILKLEISYKNS